MTPIPPSAMPWKERLSDFAKDLADPFVCYFCKEGDCLNCVGIPCHCSCPGKRQRELFL
jgi:hypothetical protein